MIEPRVEDAECMELEALLAARSDGTLDEAGKDRVDRHLARCSDCREIAETMAPGDDADGDHAMFPSVTRSAYALGLEVARGGMGRILAARDLRIGRAVAVKELLGNSPQLAARFEREARVTARLQHPGIVPIYEIGRWPDGTPFYSMRMVDGRTLREAIEAAPTLAGRLALLPAIIAAAEAVAFAHSQRVIHRDLTPSNVLVGAYGETVVIDWGLAKDLAGDVVEVDDAEPSSSGSGLTGVGTVIGTATYMPPEQAHGQPVDERADVYALGAILYHLLAGKPPYTGRTSAEQLRAVRTGPPKRIDEAVPIAPRDLVSIVTKAMARAPEDRYPSAHELTDELKRFQTGRMVEAHEYSTAERMVRFIRRYRAAVTVTVLATVILGVFAAVAVTRVVRSNKQARLTVRDLLVEKGRIELLAGNRDGALAYLHEAFRTGDHTPSLMFLLGFAAEGSESAPRPLDCGGDVRFIDFAPQGGHVAAACTDVGRIWSLDGSTPPITLAPSKNGFNGLIYSPSGRLLATWGREGIVRLWESGTGELLGAMKHGGDDPTDLSKDGAEISFATFSTDETKMATAGFDGVARIWDVATMKEVRSITATTGLLKHLYGVLSPDGKHMLTVTLEGEGKGWNADTGEYLGGFSHGSLVVGGEVSRDGARAITCGVNRLVKIWDATTGKHILTLAGHTDVVWKCVFNNDGTRALTAGHDGRANVWNLETGALIASVSHGDIIWTGHFSPSGRRFTTIGVDGRVNVWDAVSGALLATHDSLKGKDAKFSPDGNHLVVQRGDRRIQIWPDLSPQRASFAPPAGSSILAVSAQGGHIAVADADGWVTLWDAIARRALERPAPDPRISGPVSFAAEITRVAATTSDGVVLLDAETGRSLARLALPARPSTLQLSHDARRLLVTTVGRAPEVWQIEPPALLATLTGARHAHLSPDGHRVLAWADKELPTLWNLDLDATQPQRTLGTERVFHPIGFAAGGTRLALLESTQDTNSVSLWNTDDGSKLLPRPGRASDDAHVGGGMAIPKLDPSGRWLTAIQPNHRVMIWDTLDGRPHASFAGEQLTDAQANATGELVVVLGEYGKTVVVMSATDGRVLARWPLAHDAPAIRQEEFLPPSGTASWSPDGSAIVSRSATITVWRAAAATEQYGIAAAQKTLPFRVVRGQLELVTTGRLRGRVVAAGRAMPGVKVGIEIRTPPIGNNRFNWSLLQSQSTMREDVTDGDGDFELTGLVPGSYALSVTAGDQTLSREVSVSTEDESVTIDLSAR